MTRHSKKFPLGPGSVESKWVDGRGTAQRLFLETLRTLYPRVFSEAQEHPTALDSLSDPFWPDWQHRHRLITTDTVCDGPQNYAPWIVSGVWYELRLERMQQVDPGLRCRDWFRELPRVTIAAHLLEGAGTELNEGDLSPLYARPTEETKPQFLRRAGRHFNAVERQLFRLGVRKVRHRPISHFEWLTHYLVGQPRRSFGQIAIRFGSPSMKLSRDRGASTVWKSINSLASFIGLKLPAPR